ncbi:hypothetical protein VP1G_08801 [Cytospora mali]|uniref:Uncharacterized protein n=1 Tax=Cytospora mali TaxID=578113 RepID=A0A194VCW6_CYTMA|nr:hypothetical protein VP1G_08801 [Valsa mali var. pyri (nom. inval.)]
MPPTPTPRCYRAIQRRTNASCDAVWVTDDVLGRAFQRYLNNTGVKRRMVSSVPGPMYHRQRHGRRRMTELNSFQSAGALPIWALPNAPDMTKWTWEPPKDPSCWPQLPQLPQHDIEPEAPLFLEAVPQLCEPPQPPDISALGQSDTAKEEAAPRLLEESSSPLGVGLETLYNTRFSTGKDFNLRFESLVRLLQREISNGQLRGEQVLVVYKLARRVFVRAGCDLPELKGASLLPLLSAVIKGISAAKRLNPAFVTSKPQLWILLLKHLARQEIGEKSAGLFALVTESMPAKCRFRTRGAVLNVLHAYFKLWQDSTIHGKPEKWSWSEASKTFDLATMWAGRVDELSTIIKSDLALGQVGNAKLNMDTAQNLHERSRRFTLKTAILMSDDRTLARKVAEALKNHDPQIHRSLFVIATRLLGKPRVSWTRAHYNWLQVLARLPKIRHSQYKQLLQFFPKRGRVALSHVELCDLLLLHWDSQGMLKDKVQTRHCWNKARGGNDSIALAALAFAINTSHNPEECTVLFWSFWEFVRLRPGYKTIIKQVLSLSGLKSLSRGFLQRLAWTSNDPRVAILLHNILVKQSGKEHSFWWPAFWDKFSTQFSHKWKYPWIDPLVIAGKLLGPDPNGRSVSQKYGAPLHGQHNKKLGRGIDEPLKQIPKLRILRGDSNKDIRQYSRIKGAFKLISGAPHLTERRKLQYITGLTRFLNRVQGFLTARDLSNLTAVVTQGLGRGEYGRTQRLKWFLGIIYEQLGEEACAQVGMRLRRQREANWIRWRDQFRRRRESMGQRPVFTLTPKNYEGPHQGRAWPLWRYYVTKNRHRMKRLGRLKAKARAGLLDHEAVATAQQPHEKPTGSQQSVADEPPATKDGRTYDEDVLGTLLKQARQPKIDHSVSF